MITLRRMQDLVNAIETLYPARELVDYAEMNLQTRDDFLKVIPNLQRLTVVDERQIACATFAGIQFRINPEIQDGVIRVYNDKDEVLYELKL